MKTKSHIKRKVDISLDTLGLAIMADFYVCIPEEYPFYPSNKISVMS